MPCAIKWVIVTGNYKLVTLGMDNICNCLHIARNMLPSGNIPREIGNLCLLSGVISLGSEVYAQESSWPLSDVDFYSDAECVCVCEGIVSGSLGGGAEHSLCGADRFK